MKITFYCEIQKNILKLLYNKLKIEKLITPVYIFYNNFNNLLNL